MNKVITKSTKPKQKTKKKKQNQTKINMDKSVILGQPTSSCCPSTCGHILGQPTSSCCPSTCGHTVETFTHSNLPFSPSFNLSTNKKSTPVHQAHLCNSYQPNMNPIFPNSNCTNVHFQNTKTQTRAHSVSHPAHSSPKQTQTQVETKADVHENRLNTSNIIIDESFHSC